jgi:DNA-binding response OmpR family regulator
MRGLELGADDYVTKFSIREPLARSNACAAGSQRLSCLRIRQLQT